MLLTKRKYKVAILEDGSFTTHVVDFDELAVEDSGESWEYIYALQDIGDAVLDLKAGESIYFQPNRDNKDTKGILYRIK